MSEAPEKPWKKMLHRSRIYPVVLIAVAFGVYKCRQSQKAEPLGYYYEGNTMGTTYHLKYADPEGRDFRKSVDSLLLEFNAVLSTYEPESDLSKFNRGETLSTIHPWLWRVIRVSERAYTLSDGAFDPTVMPLVNAWSFGPAERTKQLLDSAAVDSLRQFIGFNQVIGLSTPIAAAGKVTLDFSATAKGLGVDVVADFLRSKGIKDFMVEIGGEVVVQGQNPEGGPWRLGVNDPRTAANEVFQVIAFTDRAMATSGNYRNYFIVDGVRYAHTIDPRTGFPTSNELRSVTILADDCATADAFATTFMVLGLEEAKRLTLQEEDLESFLIYEAADGSLKTWHSPGMDSLLVY